MTNGTPIHLAPPNTPPYPDHYMVYFTVQTCQCCGRSQVKQEVYAITYLQSKFDMGKRVRNARPVQWPRRGVPDALYNLPIRTEARPMEYLPFCFMCNEPSLAHWPDVPVLEPEQVTRVVLEGDKVAPGYVARATPERSETRSTRSEPKSSGSKVKTVDDILKMF